MTKVFKYLPGFILVALLGVSAARGQSLPPRIFFTDLTSGPNTGGENNNGTILTIYGKNFGAAQGTSTVTVGGGAVAAYLQWGVPAPGEMGTQKIAVAIGSAAATGNVVVTVGGVASNGVPFTVRTGNIFCVSTTGNDSNAGTFPSSCWATIVKAKDTIAAGDIAYIENGVSQTTQDNDNATVDIRSGSGTAAAPKALVGYPGATVTVGSNSVEMGFRTVDSDSTAYWVIANISNATAATSAFELDNSTAFRVVGLNITCPNGDASAASFISDGGTGSGTKVLGNYIHNTGNTCVSSCHTYHALYFSTNNVSWEAAWNTIVPDPSKTGVAGCKGIEVYSTGGADQYDIHIHDNIIHDVICDGIDLNTVNPDGANTMGGQGSVEAYNNVVYRVGTGPDPQSASDYGCMEVGATAAHTNPIQIYNNSFYDCGSRGNADSGMISYSGDGAAKINLRNNIFNAIVAGSFTEPYFTANSSPACSNSSGGNNVWFGAGAPPCGTLFTANVTGDPLFIDPVSTRNFRLQSTSPAINAGTTISTLFTDLDGVSRPQGTAYDMGAYEFVSGTVAVRPNPPTNLTVVSIQ